MAYYKEYSEIVRNASQKYGVKESLIWAVIEQESGGNSAAVNTASGATGLMQLMPATAKQYGVKDRLDPEQNVMGGTALLSDLLDRYNGDTESALAAYYAGPGNVSRYGKEKYSWYYTDVMDKMIDDLGSLKAPEGGFFDHGAGDIFTDTGIGDSSGFLGGTFEKAGLEWWGDLLLVILILACVVLGIIFVYLAINGGGTPADLVKGMVK